MPLVNYARAWADRIWESTAFLKLSNSTFVLVVKTESETLHAR
jgi:hypothetical protein